MSIVGKRLFPPKWPCSSRIAKKPLAVLPSANLGKQSVGFSGIASSRLAQVESGFKVAILFAPIGHKRIGSTGRFMLLQSKSVSLKPSLRGTKSGGWQKPLEPFNRSASRTFSPYRPPPLLFFCPSPNWPAGWHQQKPIQRQFAHFSPHFQRVPPQIAPRCCCWLATHRQLAVPQHTFTLTPYGNFVPAEALTGGAPLCATLTPISQSRHLLPVAVPKAPAAVLPSIWSPPTVWPCFLRCSRLSIGHLPWPPPPVCVWLCPPPGAPFEAGMAAKRRVICHGRDAVAFPRPRPLAKAETQFPWTATLRRPREADDDPGRMAAIRRAISRRRRKRRKMCHSQKMPRCAAFLCPMAVKAWPHILFCWPNQFPSHFTEDGTTVQERLGHGQSGQCQLGRWRL